MSIKIFLKMTDRVKTLLLSVGTVILSASQQVSAYDIKCGSQSCDKYATPVQISLNDKVNILYHYLVDVGIKIPLPADQLSAIGSPVTFSNRSFTTTYYYGDKYSVGLFFIDEDLKEDYDLLGDTKHVYLFSSGDIKAYFYESNGSNKTRVGPIFKAIIPFQIGSKERYVTYMARGLKENRFKELIGLLEATD